MVSPTEISNNLIAPSKASIQHGHSDFFGGAGHGTVTHHTAKPVVTSHAPVNTAPTFPGVTDQHMMDAFHTHGPHDLLHGHVHPEPQLVLHDSLHHHIPHTHEVLPSVVGVTKPKLQTKSTTVKQRITTTPAPPTTKAANEMRNLIVGDWSGAEQSLSGNQPPPPPSRDLALEHPHGHHHFESHVHGFTKPSIPPPPPTAEMVLSTNPVDVQPTDQSMDKQPTLQIVDVQPVGQQIDIQPSSQLIDLHHPNQPIDTHLVGVLDNITPKNASLATGNTVAKSASTGTRETSGVNNVLVDPNIGHLSHDPLHSITDHGHSIHDLGHLVTDPGTLAHQAGPASHGHGHNLSAGNSTDFNSNFMNILDKNLNQHLGKYKSALVYLYDPYNGTLSQANGLDIVEIALNLTDLPLHIDASPLNLESHAHNENANMTTSKPVLSELRKVSHTDVSALQNTYDVATPSSLNQTQIDSNNMHESLSQIIKPTTPSVIAFDVVDVSNTSNNVAYSYVNQSTVNQTETNVLDGKGNNTNILVKTPNHSASANATTAANVTAPTDNSTLFSMEITTAVGSTTLDPDYLADLAEAQEEAEQLAAELAEAGIGMSTTSMTTVMSTDSAAANITALPSAAANSVTNSSANANGGTTPAV